MSRLAIFLNYPNTSQGAIAQRSIQVTIRLLAYVLRDRDAHAVRGWRREGLNKEGRSKETLFDSAGRLGQRFHSEDVGLSDSLPSRLHRIA